MLRYGLHQYAIEAEYESLAVKIRVVGSVVQVHIYEIIELPQNFSQA